MNEETYEISPLHIDMQGGWIPDQTPCSECDCYSDAGLSRCPTCGAAKEEKR